MGRAEDLEAEEDARHYASGPDFEEKVEAKVQQLLSQDQSVLEVEEFIERLISGSRPDPQHRFQNTIRILREALKRYRAERCKKDRTMLSEKDQQWVDQVAFCGRRATVGCFLKPLLKLFTTCRLLRLSWQAPLPTTGSSKLSRSVRHRTLALSRATYSQYQGCLF